MSYGLLSGKYDSTKQRAVLLNGERIRNYKRYTLTLRLEMLLTGGIVLTDSQFFDGLYFFWLANNTSEFNAFKKCIRNDKNIKSNKHYIDVKCRYTAEDGANAEDVVDVFPNKDDVAKSLFCKEFYNSSIEMKELAKYVFELSKDFSEKIIDKKDSNNSHTVRKPENTLEEYIENTKKYLKELYGENIAECWDKYSEVLQRLFEVELGRWGYYEKTTDGSGMIVSEKWNSCFNIDKLLEQQICGIDITYRKKLENLLQIIERESPNISAKKYFKRLESEIYKKTPNRSKIVVWLGELLELIENNNIDKKTKDSLQECIREFKCIINDRFNKAFAVQHGCKFIDMCDYPQILKKITAEEHKVIIENDILMNLGDMSWSEFYSLIEGLKAETEKWLEAYDAYTENGEEQKLIASFNNYIDLLKIQINGANNSSDRIDTDYSDTVNIDILKIIEALKGANFVGGGSYEELKEANEICILCQHINSSKKQPIILRLQREKTGENDKNYDTMIAPVENIYNGGLLDV